MLVLCVCVCVFACGSAWKDSVLRVLYLLAPATLFCRDTAGWLPVDVAEAFGRESTVALLSALPPVKVEDIVWLGLRGNKCKGCC